MNPTPEVLRARLAEPCMKGQVDGWYWSEETGRLPVERWRPDLDIAQAFMCEAAMIARGWEPEHWLNLDDEYVWSYEKTVSGELIGASAHAKEPAAALALAIYRALEAEESETCP